MFYNEKGDILKTVPDAITNLFKNEYNILLGYNANTGMLYGHDAYHFADDPMYNETGCNCATEPSISASAKQTLLGELGNGVSTQKLIVGHKLGIKGQPVEGGAHTTNTTLLDLNDWNSDLSLKEANYDGLDRRTFNLARLFEHEFIGHRLNKLSDFPNSGRSPGPCRK